MTQKALRELVRVSYVKVAEYQRRGLVHLHVVIRLDRAMPAYRGGGAQAARRRGSPSSCSRTRSAPPPPRSRAPLPDELGGGRVRWGDELDVAPARRARAPRGRRLPGQVRDQEHRAGRRRRCTASPSTSSTSCPCASTSAPTCAQAFALAADPALADRRFAAYAHALGYRGHCLTKSRRYSTTFKALREARERHVHEQLLAPLHAMRRNARSPAAVERVASFRYVGQGHLTAADELLAASAAARAREHRRLAREELAMCDPRGVSEVGREVHDECRCAITGDRPACRGCC